MYNEDIVCKVNNLKQTDVLNIIMLFDTKTKESFKKLTPTNFVISNNDGKFNRDFTIQKEQRLSVYVLNN